MKLFILAALMFLGCATNNHELNPSNKMDRFLCEADVCDSFARSHDYTLLESKVSNDECECHLQSPYMPDAFVVKLKIHSRK